MDKKFTTPPDAEKDFGVKNPNGYALPLVAHSWTKSEVRAYLKKQAQIKQEREKRLDAGQLEMFGE